MAEDRVLVAGVGNVFLGDDGFGVAVVRRLLEVGAPDGADVRDFGVRGVHLAYELADGKYSTAILVDAVPGGHPPGTLSVIEPGAEAGGDGSAADAHSLTPASVLAWVRRIGGSRTRVLVVGCEPQTIDEAFALSPPVAASVDAAVAMVRAQVAEAIGHPV